MSTENTQSPEEPTPETPQSGKTLVMMPDIPFKQRIEKIDFDPSAFESHEKAVHEALTLINTELKKHTVGAAQAGLEFLGANFRMVTFPSNDNPDFQPHISCAFLARVPAEREPVAEKLQLSPLFDDKGRRIAHEKEGK